MTKITNNPITAAELTAEFMRLRRGSVTRRHFLGVTGLGLAAAVMGRTGAFSLDAWLFRPKRQRPETRERIAA